MPRSKVLPTGVIEVLVDDGTPKPQRGMRRHRHMRTNVAVAVAGCVAALAGWWVRGIEWRPAEPMMVAAQHEAPERTLDVPAGIQRHSALPRESRGSRNLFAYREAPAAVERVAYVAPSPVPIAREAVPLPPTVETRPRLRFASRYIGPFRARSQSDCGIRARRSDSDCESRRSRRRALRAAAYRDRERGGGGAGRRRTRHAAGAARLTAYFFGSM